MCIKKLYYGVFVILWPMFDFMAYLEEHKHIWIKLIFTLCPDGTLWHQIWRIHMYVYISTARPCRGFSVKLKDKRYMENIFKLSWKYYSSENGKFTIHCNKLGICKIINVFIYTIWMYWKIEPLLCTIIDNGIAICAVL